jgi:Hemerythrin HHE cation binding domain
MLEKLLLPEKHAIAILIKDHDRVKALFERFEKSESAREKEKIIGEALTELKIHAAIEEEIFYPAVRNEVGKDLMNEADEEHHVARVLIAELDRGRPGDDHREAKFTVLAESVRHHIKEEEGEMLPQAKSLGMDFEALGQRMLDRKQQLKRDGIPPDAEHAMVSAMKGSGDSPATRARRGGTAPMSRSRKTKTSHSRTKSKMVRSGKLRKPASGTKADHRRRAAG